MKRLALPAVLALCLPLAAVAYVREVPGIYAPSGLGAHPNAQALFARKTQIVESGHSGQFSVLVTPNLVPKAAALVAAVNAGRVHCARLGQHDLGLRSVKRHSRLKLDAWQMYFSCR
ncbi:hypothetical protein [Oceaniglobus roseus]|uniref:hypothetical protein n=1 Tax=Oceaniglobus roseus TaxID=1737570 RepID=UPI000C7F5884|nr:hypothetical protein [Kandeliimicrobium roseum]